MLKNWLTMLLAALALAGCAAPQDDGPPPPGSVAAMVASAPSDIIVALPPGFSESERDLAPDGSRIVIRSNAAPDHVVEVVSGPFHSMQLISASRGLRDSFESGAERGCQSWTTTTLSQRFDSRHVEETGLLWSLFQIACGKSKTRSLGVVQIILSVEMKQAAYAIAHNFAQPPFDANEGGGLPIPQATIDETVAALEHTYLCSGKAATAGSIDPVGEPCYVAAAERLRALGAPQYRVVKVTRDLEISDL